MQSTIMIDQTLYGKTEKKLKSSFSYFKFNKNLVYNNTENKNVYFINISKKQKYIKRRDLEYSLVFSIR
jgi:hypothetical protein